MADNIKVVIKVRPLINRELDENSRELWMVKENSIYPVEQFRDGDNTFTFDHIFDSSSQTDHVYDIVARPIVESAVDGINGTIFAYGQTSSGKTYTMMGDGDSPGVIPLAVQNIFDKIESITNRDFLLRVSYIEIYNEKIRDLLDITNSDLKVHDDFNGWVRVDAKEKVVSTPQEVLELMKKGNGNRVIGDTQMNERSSRSHTIFYIIIESRRHVSNHEDEDDSVNVSQLNLVDLAGSERPGQTGATKLRLREGGHINKSLSALGLVIRQLSDPNRGPNTYISFRDSKLTFFLKNSLGGNSKTGIICAITPAVLDETQSTLMFAMSAKVVQNIPKVNAVISDATLIKKLTKNMAKLQEELENKRLLENDNKKLQEQLSELRKMILMGHTKEVKSNTLRRRTWCAPQSKLNTISEHYTSQNFALENRLSGENTTFQHPDLSNITQRRDSKRNTNIMTPIASKVSSLEHFDIIEIDDTPEASPKTAVPTDYSGCTTPPVCSPYHKCFNVQQTPPCILKNRAHHAEREFHELQELTTLEKMYSPEVVELLQDIKVLRQENEKCNFQIEKQKEILDNCQEEINTLNQNMSLISNEKEECLMKQKNLQKEMDKFCNTNTDLQVEIENLKMRFQNREKELLASLEEARVFNSSKAPLVPLNLIVNCVKCEEQLALFTNQVDSLQKELASKDIQLNELQISSDQQECSMLRTKIVELEELLEKKDQQCTEADIKTSDVTDTMNTFNDDIDNLEKQLSERAQKLLDQSKEMETLNVTVSNLNTDIQDYKETICRYEEQTKQTLADLQTKDTHISQLEEVNIKLREELKEMHANSEVQSSLGIRKESFNISTVEPVSNLKDQEIENVESGIYEMKHTSEPNVNLERDLEISSLKSKLETLQLEISNKDQEYSAVNSKCNQIESEALPIRQELEKLRQINEEISKENLNLESKCQSLQNQLDDCNRRINELTNENSNLESKCQSLQNQLDHCNRRIDDLTNDINSKNSEIKLLLDENNNYNSVIEQREVTICELEKNIELQRENYEKMVDEKDQLLKNVDDLKQLNNSLSLNNGNYINELDNLKVELNEKTSQIENLKNDVESINKQLDSLSIAIIAKSTQIDDLKYQVETLKQELSDSVNEGTGQKNYINDLTVSNDSLKNDLNLWIQQIETLTSGVINRDVSHLTPGYTCTQLSKLTREIGELMHENEDMRNGEILLENKENLSIKLEKKPLSIHQDSLSNVGTPNLKSTKNMKEKKDSDVLKQLFEFISSVLEDANQPNINLCLINNPEFSDIKHILDDFKTVTKLNVDDLNQRNSCLEDQLKTVQSTFSLINNNIKFISDIISNDFRGSDDSGKEIRNNIKAICRHISPHLSPDSSLRNNNLYMESLTQNERDNVPVETENQSQNDVNIEDFIDFLNNNVSRFYGLVPIQLTDDNIYNVSVQTDVLTKFNTLKYKCENLFSKIENHIKDLNEKVVDLQSQCDTMQADYTNAEIQIRTLCEESEHLFKKVISKKNECLVSDAESTFKNSVLFATEHFHNNLHSTCMKTLMVFKEQLTMLETLLRNPDLAQPDIFNEYSNITNQYVEQIETEMKDSTLKIVETKLPEMSPESLDGPNNEVVDRSICTDLSFNELDIWKSDYESKCTEIKHLQDKIAALEPLKQQFDGLVNERDSLSMQLMEYLEDIESLKKKCSVLTDEALKCTCKNTELSPANIETVRVQQNKDDTNLIPLCIEFITEHIIDKSILGPSKNLLDLLLIYTDSMNHQLELFQVNRKELENVVSSLKSELEEKALFDSQKEVSLKSSLDLEEQIVNQKLSIEELTMKLKEQNDCNNKYRLEKETEIDELKNQINEKKSQCESVERKLNQYECERNELSIQVNELQDIKQLNTKHLKALEEAETALRDNIATSETKIKEAQLEEQKLISEVNHLKSQLKEREQLKGELSSRIFEMESQINEYMSINETLKRELEVSEFGKQNLIDDVNKLKSQLEESNGNYSKCIENMECKMKEIMTLKEKTIDVNLQLEQNLTSLNTIISELEKEREGNQKEIATYQAAIEDKRLEFKTLLNEKNTQIETKINEIKELKNEKQNLEDKLSAMEPEQLKVMTDIKVLEEKLRVSEKKYFDIEYTIQEYTKNNKKLYEPYFDKLKIDDSCIFNTFLTNMMNLQENLTVDLKSKQTQIDTLNQNVEFLQNLLKDKDLVIGKKCAELEENMANLAELKQDILKYNSERKLAEEEKLSLLSNNEGLSKLLNEKDTEIADKISEISLLKSNHRNTLSLQLEIEKLKQDILRRDESIVDLENQLTSTGNKLNGVTNQLVELSSLKSVNTILENQVSELQTELNTLLRSSSKLRTDHLHLKRQSLHDLHRNLSSSVDEDNDTSDSSKKSENTVKELKSKCKMLEEKINEVDTLYSETLQKLNQKSDENEHLDNMLSKAQVKCDELQRYLDLRSIIKVDASTNTSSNRPEDNAALMDMFVDKLTHNHLKEKYNNLVKMNEDLRFKHKEQAAVLRRLEHSRHYASQMEPEQNRVERESEIAALKEQLNVKQKEFEELKAKYDEMDAEYDDCVALYNGCIKSYNELSSEKCLLEAEIKNLQEQIKDEKELKRLSPGSAVRKKRQSVHDYNRGLCSSTTDSSTNTSFDKLTSAETAAPCVECKKLRTDWEELKRRHNDLLHRFNTQPPINMLASTAAGSGIVQNQHLDEYMKENEILKLKLSKYKQYILQLKGAQRK